jgi:hypothetical protein
MAPQSSAIQRPLPPALVERRLRANPAFELVLFDRLPAADRRRLAALAQDPDHYGVLRPRPGSGLGLKAVDRETALLVLTLAEPGPLPAYVRRRLGEGVEPGRAAALAAVARLVADGVLEIESAGGGFVSGAAAMALLAPPDAMGVGRGLGGGMGDLAHSAAAADGGAGAGRPAALSRAALHHAEELARTLPGIEAQELSLRLYGYNRRPLTPAWRRLLPSPAAVRGYLGVAAGGGCHELAGRYWQEEPVGAGEGWLRWRSRSPAMIAGSATYKLYVGVPAEALPGCFAAFLDGLAAGGAPGFKVGGGASGLLRPDKLVAYFPTFDGLALAASALGERLRGIAPQGVPFSAEISGGGLLSWGMDPPPGVGTGVAAERRISWRLWLTNRLARALLAAVHAEAAADAAPPAAAPPSGADAPAIEPWRFAIERLRLEGVDAETWAPRGGIWRPLAGGG